MPELPEVETTRRGIAPAIVGLRIEAVTIRDTRLRWPVSDAVDTVLPGLRFQDVRRRGKYLLLDTEQGVLMIHLGMSGSLRIVPAAAPAGKHDHFDILFERAVALRFTDPRRFGAILWHAQTAQPHPLLCHLGPEPLDGAFDGAYLKAASRGRRVAVKNFIMDSTVVVGVGNIYASEALFKAGIHPARPAGRISLHRYEELAQQIKQVLQQAIEVGGTTLRDFTGSDGRPGYFKQSLNVYGRGGEPCYTCGQPLRERRLGQRSTVFCHRCQV